MLTMIAAVGRNFEIGRAQQLIWTLPQDQKFFRSVTKGKTVVMGRKTFESIGRPLPKRENVIITGNKDYKAAGARVICGLEKAVEEFSKKSGESGSVSGPLDSDSGALGSDSGASDSGSGKYGSDSVESGSDSGTEGSDEDIFIIGGSAIYEAFLPFADKIYLTHIDAECPDADSFFPKFQESGYLMRELSSFEEDGLRAVIREYTKLREKKAGRSLCR